MRPRTGRVVLCAVFALGCAATALADPGADAVSRMAAAIAGLGDYEVRFTSTFSMDTSEEAENIPPTQVRVCREGPSRLAVECAAEPGTSRIVANDEGLYASMPSTNQYLVLPPVGSRSEFSTAFDEQMLGLALEFEPGMLPQWLFTADLSQVLPTSEGDAWTVTGEEPISDIACEHLLFASEDEEIHVWIRKEEPALPMAVALRFRIYGEDGEKAEMVEAFRSEVASWDLAPTFAPETWAWTAPEGAEQVESLLSGEYDVPTPLLGEEAPDFTLADLDGKPVQLSEVLDGETVVLIDFWATWCSPCRDALPVYTKIAAEYKDKGVVFLAVSQGDTAEDIATCLAEMKIAPHVLLDTDCQVGMSYGAEGIPHMVIVGKDGVIQAVHVGWTDDGEASTRADLDAILAGQTPPSCADSAAMGGG